MNRFENWETEELKALRAQELDVLDLDMERLALQRDAKAIQKRLSDIKDRVSELAKLSNLSIEQSNERSKLRREKNALKALLKTVVSRIEVLEGSELGFVKRQCRVVNQLGVSDTDLARWFPPLLSQV